MKDRMKKVLYDVAGGILGAIITIALIAAIYAHLWLGEFSNSPASELALIFFESVEAEKSRMEDLRILGTAITVVGLSLLASITPDYYRIVDEPRWEAKKGLAVALFLFLLGGAGYLQSSDLVGESVGLALLLLGVLDIVAGSAYLVVTAPD